MKIKEIIIFKKEIFFFLMTHRCCLLLASFLSAYFSRPCLHGASIPSANCAKGKKKMK